MNTISSKVWETINTIRGRPPSKIPILHINNRCISTVSGIANAFAIAFENVSSELNYSRSFLEHKNKLERQALNFSSTNAKPYNVEFTMQELQVALETCKATMELVI